MRIFSSDIFLDYVRYFFWVQKCWSLVKLERKDR